MHPTDSLPRLLRFRLLIASIALSVLVPVAQASTPADAALEALLQKALARSMDPAKAVRAYVSAGVVEKKPNTRIDYTDYYVVDRPARFLGHDLQMIEQEYRAAYVGCCVSPGMGITVRLDGSADDLRAFAARNKCRVKDDTADFDEVMKSLKRKPKPGRYATVSCRERDRE